MGADTYNAGTGSNSTNTNSVDINQSSHTSVSNTSSVSNSMNFNLSTGSNGATANTWAGDVRSGDVDVDLEVQNETGTQSRSATLPGSGGTFSYSSDNTNTGPGSTNVNVVHDRSSTSVDIRQEGRVNNNVNLDVRTGGNVSSGNTFSGTVMSGSIRINTSIRNEVNTGIGGDVEPPPDGGGGGGGVTPPPGGGGAPISAFPENPAIFAGIGGEGPEMLPVAYQGIGGGYVPAGSSAVFLQMLLLLAVASMYVFGGPALRRKWKNMVHRASFFRNAADVKKTSRRIRLTIVSAVVALTVAVYPAVPVSVMADETAPTPTPTAAAGAVTDSAQTVGPTGTIGPQGTLGPTGTIGPQPQVTVTVTPSPSVTPTASSSGSTSQSNDQTGPSSTNTNSQNSSTDTSSTTVKDATVTNDHNATLNTGNNSADGNTSVGQVQSGEVNGAVNVINIANSDFAEGSSIGSQSVNAGSQDTIVLGAAASRSALPGQLSNGTTGPNSTNGNVLQDSNVLDVIAINTARANNNTVVNANTGNNNLTNNTQVGALQTGDINLAVNVLNILNVNMPNTQLTIDAWTVLTNNPNSAIVVPEMANAGTGPGSDNSNSVASESNTSITVRQHALAENGITVNGTTGNNTLSNNSASGYLATGTVNADGSVINVANADQPVFYIVNVLGDWNGTLQGMPPNSFVINRLTNIETGPDSDNSNVANTSNDTDVNVQNNATARNNLLVNANTGGNTLSNNTSVGGVKTGSINVLANLMNFLNSASNQAGSFRIGIINVFGRPAPIANPSGSDTVQEMPGTKTVVTQDPNPVGAQVTVPVPSDGTEDGIGGGTGRYGKSGTQKYAKYTWQRAGSSMKLASATNGSDGQQLTADMRNEQAGTTARQRVSSSHETDANDPFGLFAQASGGTATKNTRNNKPLALGLGLAAILWLGVEVVAWRKQQHGRIR